MANDVKVQRARRALDEEIAALQQQAVRARRRHPRQPIADEAVPSPAPAQTPQEQPLTGSPPPSPAAPTLDSGSPEALDADQSAAIRFITTRTNRLEDIKRWITEDSDLLPLIAKAAGDVEGKYLRKNVVISIILSTIFLFAGWLLSIVATPGNLVRIIGH